MTLTNFLTKYFFSDVRRDVHRGGQLPKNQKIPLNVVQLGEVHRGVSPKIFKNKVRRIVQLNKTQSLIYFSYIVVI